MRQQPQHQRGAFYSHVPQLYPRIQAICSNSVASNNRRVRLHRGCKCRQAPPCSLCLARLALSAANFCAATRNNRNGVPAEDVPVINTANGEGGGEATGELTSNHGIVSVVTTDGVEGVACNAPSLELSQGGAQVQQPTQVSTSSNYDLPPGRKQPNRHHWFILQNYQSPAFLTQYPAKDSKTYTHNSFLGRLDPHDGKYSVPTYQRHRFLEEYLLAYKSYQPLHMTENYREGPIRYFQELDIPFEVPKDALQSVVRELLVLIPAVVASFFELPSKPTMVVSMRTPYKVHLNFPELVTNRWWHAECRAAIITAAAEQLGAELPFDLDKAVDTEHGSMRMLGSRKAPWMASKDPKWVKQRVYLPVDVDQDWSRPLPLSLELLEQASIHPSFAQQDAFSQLYPDNAVQMKLAVRSAKQQQLPRRELMPAVQRVYTGAGAETLPKPRMRAVQISLFGS